MSIARSETPQSLAAVHAFAKKHTASSFLRFLCKFRPPTVEQDIASQLQTLHRVRVGHEHAAQQIETVDHRIAKRLATNKLHATELIELKLQPPSEKAAAHFDADAHSLATLVKHARDVEKASSLGLAFAIWFRTELNQRGCDSQLVRQESYSRIHQVFKALDAQGLLNNRPAVAFCQAALTAKQPITQQTGATQTSATQPSAKQTGAKQTSALRGESETLVECLKLDGFVEWLLRASGETKNVQLLLAFASFLIDQNHNYNGFAAVEFLKQLANFDEANDIIQKLSWMQRRSTEPVPDLPEVFATFRFPSGLSRETVELWNNSQRGNELLARIAKLLNPCAKTRIPYLSPDAQTLAYFADQTLHSHAADPAGPAEPVSNEDYTRRWELFLKSIAGIELSRDGVRSRFIEIVSDPSLLKQLLRQSLRPKLIRKIADDGSDRECWVLSKLLEAAGKLTPEDYSMCSICLGSGYLFDTEGRFCNRKTFRDFAAFVDRDIQNLRAFIDPKLEAGLEGESGGHVRRLMSFIRDFLIDPDNAHYTNFEVYRTKAFTVK